MARGLARLAERPRVVVAVALRRGARRGGRRLAAAPAHVARRAAADARSGRRQPRAHARARGRHEPLARGHPLARPRGQPALRRGADAPTSRRCRPRCASSPRITSTTCATSSSSNRWLYVPEDAPRGGARRAAQGDPQAQEPARHRSVGRRRRRRATSSRRACAPTARARARSSSASRTATSCNGDFAWVAALPPGGLLVENAGQGLLDAVRAFVAAHPPSAFHPRCRSCPPGPSWRRCATARRSSTTSSSVTIACIVVIGLSIVLYFRSLRALPLVVAPALLGTLVAFAAAAFAFGYLNSSTAFLGSIILGNGINYAIVLLAAFRERRARRRRAGAEALARAVEQVLAQHARGGRSRRRRPTRRSRSRASAASRSSASWAPSAASPAGRRRSSCCRRCSRRFGGPAPAPRARRAPRRGRRLPGLVARRPGAAARGRARAHGRGGSSASGTSRTIRSSTTSASSARPTSGDPQRRAVRGRRAGALRALAHAQRARRRSRRAGRADARRHPRAGRRRAPARRPDRHASTTSCPARPTCSARKLALLREIRKLASDPGVATLDAETRRQIRDNLPPATLAALGPDDLPRARAPPVHRARRHRRARAARLSRRGRRLDVGRARAARRSRACSQHLRLADGTTIDSSGPPMVFGAMVRSILHDGPRASLPRAARRRRCS